MSEIANSSAVEQRQDQLNEVNLELGLKVQTMMQIDTNNTFEKAFCLILVSVVTFITVIVSLSFHSQIHVNSTVIKIPLEDNLVKGEASLSNISPFNRFSYLEVRFRRVEANSEFNSKVHVNYQIVTLDDDSITNHIILQANDEIRNVIFRKNNIESEKLTLFNDRMLNFEEYKLFLCISGRALQSFTYLEINWGYGDRAITYVFIIIRAVYMVIMIVMFFIYTRLMFRIKFRVWTTEQKLTYFLIIVCFLSDYPLSDINLGKSTLIVKIISIILNSIFQSFTLFFVISIFSGLKVQHTSSDLILIMIFGLIIFIVTIIESISSIINFVNLCNYQFLSNQNHYLHSIPIFCKLFLNLMTIFIIVVFSASSDETEFSRFITYSIHTFMMLIVTFPAKMMKNEIQYSYIASLIEVTGYNSFVITMSYFHWTYTVMTGTSYQDSSIQEIKQDIMIEKIVDNQEDKKNEVKNHSDSFNISDENDEI